MMENLHHDYDYGNSNVQYHIPDKYLSEYAHINDNMHCTESSKGSQICFGCCCEDSCSEAACVCLAEHGNNYTKDRTLSFIDNLLTDPYFTKPVFECNSCCICGLKCQNRVVQMGLKFKLQVYPTDQKGFGAKALEKIPKGSYVIDYAGEVLTYSEAARRITHKEAGEKNYLLTVREKFGPNLIRTDIDAEKFGNVSRFINHSCAPNLLLHPVRIESSVPRLALFAKRTIEIGEELSFDYSGGLNDDDCHSRRTSCKCGSTECKGFLPAEPLD
eukprot:Seg4402.2 transcript_id=Seg4402.2/GoldUCD/mRNA.D3Y31 product="Histone-lysine N-methyltransferase SETMAR" protein_id=Seg4402.2/GoldUCD/D3Y31